MIVLGLNSFGHDAAAVLLVDGRCEFAASEERFDRRRHSSAFPSGAIRAALRHAGLAPRDVDLLAFPWRRDMGRWAKLRHVVRHFPRSVAFLREAPDAELPGRLTYLRHMRRLEHKLREIGFEAPLRRVDHHLAHAVSGTLVLPEGRGAVLTADGMGEWTTAAAWTAPGSEVRVTRRASYPHSAGKAYSAVTQWLGFRPESGEGKTMGLAAYGDAGSDEARYVRGLVFPHPTDLLRVDLSAFDFPWGHRRLYGSRFAERLGPARAPEEELRTHDADVARGIQDAIETTWLTVAQQHVRETRPQELALAGGLFLNCSLNATLVRGLSIAVRPFPVAGDAGAAWGAAAWAYQEASGRPAEPLRTLRLGTAIGAAEARAALGRHARRPPDPAAEVAQRIARGEIVGVARGRAEFGPRALGGRSLLASPRAIEIRDRLNRLKGREAWRPLAPVVLENDSAHFRDLGASPWMILTFDATAKGRERIPGAIHTDGSARVQTVSESDEPFLAAVLGALDEMGEPPVVLNTSFNRRGEPIVDSAAEALTAARAMALDAVLIDDHLLELRPS